MIFMNYEKNLKVSFDIYKLLIKFACKYSLFINWIFLFQIFIVSKYERSNNFDNFRIANLDGFAKFYIWQQKKQIQETKSIIV